MYINEPRLDNTSCKSDYFGFLHLRSRVLPATILVATIWSMIYLPCIGIKPLERNETRRVIPAVTILNSGNWANIELGGMEYYKKPPMTTWMIASSFLLSGEKSNLTARLPTVMNILILAMAILIIPYRLMHMNARLISALFVLTTGGVIGIGRMASIDPNYMCFTGLALVFWLHAWSLDKHGLYMWLPTTFFLTLGLMSKGPLIFLFFYSIIIPIAILDKRNRYLLSFLHLLLISISVIFFLLCAHITEMHNTLHAKTYITSTWAKEIAMRFDFQKISILKWMARVFGGVMQFMPWGIVFFFWHRIGKIDDTDNKQKILLKSSYYGVIIPFIAINIIPLTKARYTLPILPLLAIVSGIMISKIEFNKPAYGRIAKYIISFVSIASLSISLLIITALVTNQINYIAYNLFLCQKYIDNIVLIPITELILVPIGSILLFVMHRKFDYQCTVTVTTIVKICATIAITIMLFTTIILPLRVDHAAVKCGNAINAFFPDNATIYGVNFVGREPYMFYTDRKIKTVLKIKFINKKIRFIIIEADKENDLFHYKKQYSLKEAKRKIINYHSHKYIMVAIE